MYQQNAIKINILIYYWLDKKTKGTIFLSKILIYSCIIMHYIVEENIFVAIAYKLLEQTKKWNVILNIALNGKQTIKMPK